MSKEFTIGQLVDSSVSYNGLIVRVSVTWIEGYKPHLLNSTRKIKITVNKLVVVDDVLSDQSLALAIVVLGKLLHENESLLKEFTSALMEVEL